MPSPSPIALWSRGIVLLGLSCWLVAGPFYRQVLGGQWEVPRKWTMFTVFGAGKICEVQYRQHQEGTPTLLDRYALLAPSDPKETKALRHIRSKRAALAIGQRLCDALDVPSPDVRLHARCARPEGWVVVARQRRNICQR